jgi:hypothetical protein
MQWVNEMYIQNVSYKHLVPQHTPKWPVSKPHGAIRQQAIVNTPAKWSAFQIPNVIVVFIVVLVFKV